MKNPEEIKSFDVKSKLTEIQKLIRKAKSIHKAYEEYFTKNPNLLTPEEFQCLDNENKNEPRFLNRLSLLSFTSASQSLDIGTEVNQCLVELLEGKKDLHQIKDNLLTLKRRDKQLLDKQNINSPYFKAIIAFSILTAATLLAGSLLLALLPVTWPIVVIAVFPLALIFLISTLCFLRMNLKAKEGTLNLSWGGWFENDMTSIENIIGLLKEDDIVLLKKINSSEWLKKRDAALEEINEHNKTLKSEGPSVTDLNSNEDNEMRDPFNKKHELEEPNATNLSSSPDTQTKINP